MNRKPPFAVGDTVRTIEGAKFWGVVKALYEVEPGDWRADVYATEPGFLGTLHLYPTSQLQEYPFAGEYIVAAAIRQYGLTIFLPPPARHGDLLKSMHIATGAVLPPEGQGFLTNAGRYVGRIEAADIAIQSGQIRQLQHPPCLYSEDLW